MGVRDVQLILVLLLSVHTWWGEYYYNGVSSISSVCSVKKLHPYYWHVLLPLHSYRDTVRVYVKRWLDLRMRDIYNGQLSIGPYGPMAPFVVPGLGKAQNSLQ